MLNPESPEVIVAVLGRQTKHFLESEIGQYLTNCCDAEIEKATEALKRVKPTDVEKIQELQNEIWRAESVMGWLRDVMNKGEQVEEALQL